MLSAGAVKTDRNTQSNKCNSSDFQIIVCLSQFAEAWWLEWSQHTILETPGWEYKWHVGPFCLDISPYGVGCRGITGGGGWAAAAGSRHHPALENGTSFWGRDPACLGSFSITVDICLKYPAPFNLFWKIGFWIGLGYTRERRKFLWSWCSSWIIHVVLSLTPDWNSWGGEGSCFTEHPPPHNSLACFCFCGVL